MLSAIDGNILLLSKIINQSVMPQCKLFRLDEQVRQAILGVENIYRFWVLITLCGSTVTVENLAVAGCRFAVTLPIGS